VDWIDRYAEALGEGAAAEPNERRVILKLAREVAHRTERVNAPLAAFVAGQIVATRRGMGGSGEEAALEALRVAEDLLPPPDRPAG
jgi:predicted kinase